MEKTKHFCTLKKGVPKNFTPLLPPSSSYLRKFKRWLIMKNSLNMNNAKCKEYFRTRLEMYKEQERHFHQHPFIIHPFSIMNSIREVLFLLTFTVAILFFPFEVSFTLSPSKIIVGYVIRACVIFHILLNFVTGYCDEKKQRIVLNPIEIAKKYIFTYFIFDLCPLSFFTYTGWRYCLHISHFFIYARIKTVHTLLRYNLRYFCSISESISTCITFAVTTFCMIHLFTCGLYFVPTCVYLATESFPMRSWLVEAHIDPSMMPRPDLLTIYLHCLLMASCHFFGAGLGMYPPKDVANEEILLSIILLSGRLYTLFVIANLLITFGIVSISETKYEEVLQQLLKYAIANRFPNSLKVRILKYFNHKFQKRYFNERNIISGLSDNLKSEVRISNCKNLLHISDWVSVLSKHGTIDILNCTEQEVFLPNDVIAKYRDNIDYIYFIQSGTVVILNKKGTELMHAADGDSVGLLSLLWDVREKHALSAVALEITNTYKIKKEDLIRMFKNYPEFLKQYEIKTKKAILKWENLNAAKHDVILDLVKSFESGHILQKPRKRPKYSSKL